MERSKLTDCAQKCIKSLIDFELELNQNDQNGIVYDNDFLSHVKEIIRHVEPLNAMVTNHESIGQQKPAMRINRAKSFPFGLGENYISKEKKINILSDIRLSTNNNHFGWYKNQDNLSVGQHVGASVEVEYQPNNNMSNDDDEEIATNTMKEEYLIDDGQHDGFDNVQALTTNESFVLIDAQDFAGEQYYEEQLTMQQFTAQYSYIHMCTESDVYENAETNTSEFSYFPPDNDSHHKRSLVRAAIEQMENDAEPPVQTTEKPREENHEQTSAQLSIQSADITQSGDITTTADFHMDIQAEVDVETAGTNVNYCSENDVGPMLDESDIPSRPKRQRKLKPDYELYLKELANARATSKSSKATPSTEPVKVSKELIDKSLTHVKQPDCKFAKANQKRKSAVRHTISGSRSKILGSDDKADVKANVLASSDNKQSSASMKRTNAKKPTGQSTTPTTISCVPAENQQKKRTNQRVKTYVDDGEQSSSADVKSANAKKKRSSSTRKTISFAPSECRPEILLEDIKVKIKTEKIVANANDVADKNEATSKIEKAKAKRQSTQRQTVSCSRPEISDNDNNDGKVMNNSTGSDNQLPAGAVPTKAMKKCFARRNTVSCAQNVNENDDKDASSTRPICKNTNWQMYGKNPLYQTCIYCNQKYSSSLAQHYAKIHSDRGEVVISRMSPNMAMLLKSESEIFKKDADKKITGLCYFCEEKCTRNKYCWQTHLITHTGETLFYCKECDAQLKTRNEHDTMECKSSVVNVFETRNDGSLVGFMCNDCNYLQFSRDRIIKHLENEHGYEGQSEPNHFKEYKLVEGRF